MAKDTYLNKEGLTTYHDKIRDKYNGLVQDFDTLDTFVDKLETYVLKNAFSKISITDDTSNVTTNSKDDAGSYSGGREGATFSLTVTGGLAIVEADKTAHIVKISGQSILDKFKDLKALAYKDKLLASDIPDLDASKITDGTLAPSRLPIAGTTSASLGGIFVSSIGNLTLSGSGELQLTSDNVVSALSFTPISNNTVATANNLGLIKPLKSYKNASSSLSFSEDSSSTASITINSPSTDSGKYYAIESDKNGALFVNVPWVDTTYGAGRGIIPYTSNGKTYFGHRNPASYPTASEISTTLGPTNTGTSVALKYGDTFTVPVVSYDDYGHIITDTKESSSTSVVTQSKNITFTLPSLSTEITSSSTDTTAPSSKAVYTAIYNAIDKAIASSY